MLARVWACVRACACVWQPPRSVSRAASERRYSCYGLKAEFTQSPNTNPTRSHQIPSSAHDSFTESCQRSESGALDTTRPSAHPVYGGL